MMDTLNAPQGVTTTPARPSTRPGGIGRLVARAGLLAGLAWLTWANATGSKALDEAAAAEARGDFPAALSAATEHLDRRPWSREASRIAARCLSRLDFAEQAEPYYRRGGDLSTSDLRYRAYGMTRANFRERAVRAFDEVLERQPDDVASLRLKAGLLMAMSQWNVAAEIKMIRVKEGLLVATSRWHDVAGIGRRLSMAPNGPAEVETPTSLGGHWTFRPRKVDCVPAIGATLEAMAARNQGDLAGAVEAFERVLALDPGLRSIPLDRRLFWSQFGEDLLAVGRPDEVARLLSAEDSGRSDPVLLTLVASAHARLGSPDEAESCWRRVLELDPDQPLAWLNLGRIEAGRGNSAEAIRLLARAAALEPNSVDAAYNLGLAYRRLGRVNDAREWERETARRRLLAEEKRLRNSEPLPSTSPSSNTPPAS
jgi:tetratricopeptide (TPR) repeat protein